jgi:hypothetical protein
LQMTKYASFQRAHFLRIRWCFERVSPMWCEESRLPPLLPSSPPPAAADTISNYCYINLTWQINTIAWISSYTTESKEILVQLLQHIRLRQIRHYYKQLSEIRQLNSMHSFIAAAMTSTSTSRRCSSTSRRLGSSIRVWRTRCIASVHCCIAFIVGVAWIVALWPKRH